MVSTSQSSAKSSFDFLKNLSENDIDRELCKRSFYYFLKLFWEVIIPDQYVDNWHIEYLCNELQSVAERVVRREPKAYDLIINIPPGTSKSTICTRMWPAWCWVKDSSLRFISASYSNSLSIGHAVESRDILKSDKFKAIFPDLITFKRDTDNKSLYKNTNKGDRYSTSVGGTVTGVHAHIIIVDDPLNPKQAVSDTERVTANTYLDKTLSSRKVDKLLTPTVLIMQRLHEDDCTGHLLNKSSKKIKHICLPAELSEKVSPPELREKYINGLLDPIRLGPEVLTEAKVDLGSNAYAGQYGQTPSPPEGNIFKKAWFQRFNFGDIVDTEGNRINLTWNFTIDTAYTEDQKNDPSAIMCYAFHNNNFYVRDVWFGWLEMPELIKHIIKYCPVNGYSNESFLLVEPKASGKSVAQTLRAGSSLNVIEGPPPNRDKVVRANKVTPTIEGKRVFLLEGQDWVESFIDEAATFPNAKHDDRVDTMVMMIDRHVNGKKILSISIV